MQDFYAFALTSLQNDMQQLDHVALNLANVTTPGYRRQVLAVRPFTEALQAASAQDLGSAATTAAAARTGEVLSDLRPGALKSTGQPLDLALMGEGYFEVLTDQGPAYTRKGDFSVDARGRLVTSQGFPVMGKSGDVRLTTHAPMIDASGRVSETAPNTPESVTVGQLKIVRFDTPQGLRRLGEGLFAPGQGMSVLPDGEVKLRQGALENSNVNSTREMVELIQTMRHFEAMHRVTQGYDDMLGSAVRKLTEV